MAARDGEVHHVVPRCLLTLRERAESSDLDGAGIQAWVEWEMEAMRWRVPVEIDRSELEALVEASETVLEREKSRAVLLIQLVGLVLAFTFGFFEATGLLGRESIIFNITDAAWPLSMLWMLVVGVTVLVAKRLRGWRRIVPVLCPFWLPVAMVGQATFGEAGGFVGLVLGAVLWTLLGHTVRGGEQQAVTNPEPVVR